MVTSSFSAFSPPPLLSRETQGQGGGEISIYKISEVTVTQVAELRLLQSLAGSQSALICGLILRLALCVYYSSEATASVQCVL